MSDIPVDIPVEEEEPTEPGDDVEVLPPIVRPKAFLPMISVGPETAPVGEPLSPEQQILQAMKLNPEQGRKELIWHDLLAKIAYGRCVDMAHTGYVGHVTPDGTGPNQIARASGYKLPSWYSHKPGANNIESLCWAGDGDPSGVWDAWMASEGHKIHVLGTDPFYADQTNIGIGYYYLKNSDYQHYWAVITAPPEA